MKRWIVVLSVLILAGCSSLDQPGSNLSYSEAEDLITDSPLLSTNATISYSFNATADEGSLAGTELEGQIVAQASDYPETDSFPAFKVFEGQLVLGDGSSLEASGLILGELVYAFFANTQENVFIRGRGVTAEDGSIEGPFLAFIGGESGEGRWQATPVDLGTPNPEDPTDPAPDPEDPTNPTPNPEDPADPTPDPEEPTDPGTPEPEEPTDPAEPGVPEPEEPTDPEEPQPEDPAPEDPAPEEPETPSNLPAPPETLNDPVRNGNPEVTRVFYDDEIAVYFGAGMNPDVDWMFEHIRDVWMYMKDTYGAFGPDPRMYVIVHKNSDPGYATIRNYFDADLGFRNAIDLGGSWNWEEPSAVGYEVITHELAHIVEGANNGNKESPSFEFWGDSKWAEIFMYDAYKAVGQDDWAQDWFNRMQESTGGYGNAYAFRDWYYPVYEQFGVELYDSYFKLLSECFPTRDIEVNGKIEQVHSRRANPGEVLHFFSGAAGEDLSAQFDTAFGLNSEIQGQLEQARIDMTCANTY